MQGEIDTNSIKCRIKRGRYLQIKLYLFAKKITPDNAGVMILPSCPGCTPGISTNPGPKVLTRFQNATICNLCLPLYCNIPIRCIYFQIISYISKSNQTRCPFHRNFDSMVIIGCHSPILIFRYKAAPLLFLMWKIKSGITFIRLIVRDSYTSFSEIIPSAPCKITDCMRAPL